MPATDTNRADSAQPQDLNAPMEFEDKPKKDNERFDELLATGQSAGSTSPKASVVFPTPIDNPQSLPTAIVGVKEKPDVKEPSLPVIGFMVLS